MMQQDLSVYPSLYRVRKATTPFRHTMTTTTKNPTTMMEMFIDGTVGESYAENRMLTTENERGNVSLLGFGWQKMAEYDESENHVTIYLGHKGVSQTMTRWLNNLVEIANQRRTVTLSYESPVRQSPPECVEFIDHYIDMSDMSPVERDAHNKVIESLKFLDKFL